MDLLRRHHLLLQALVGLFFLALLAWRIDLVDALERLRDVDERWVAVAALVFVLATVIEGLRWWLLLSHRAGVPPRPLVLLYIVSRMANVVLPIRGGDIVRIQIAGRRFNLSRTEVAATVFAVETPLNWVTSLAFLLIALSVLDLPVLDLTFLPPRSLFTIAGLLVGGFAAMVALSHTHRVEDYTRLWPISLLPEAGKRRAGTLLRQFVEGTETLRNAGRLIAALAVSLLIWTVQTAVFWCLGEAFGFDLLPVEYSLLTIGSVLVRTLSFSPADIGPYEFVLTQALVLLGVDANDAGSYAIGAHLWLLILTCAMGLAALWALNLRLSDLVESRADRAPEPSDD